MYYKISRNTNAYVQLIRGDVDVLEASKILLYLDTYFDEGSFVEEYENSYGTIFVSFLIQKNVSEDDPEDYDSNEDFENEIVNEIMSIEKSSVLKESGILSDGCFSCRIQETIDQQKYSSIVNFQGKTPLDTDRQVSWAFLMDLLICRI